MPRALLKLRVGLRGAGVEIRGAPLKVRSETQYLQAYLSLGAPYTSPFLLHSTPPHPVPFHPPRRGGSGSDSLRYYRGLLLISELKARIIQAGTGSSRWGRLAKIPPALNPSPPDVLGCARWENTTVFAPVFFLTLLPFRHATCSTKRNVSSKTWFFKCVTRGIFESLCENEGFWKKSIKI